jgi:hypothetical protein
VKPVADFPKPMTVAIIETGSKLAVTSRAVHMSVRRIFDRLRMRTRAKLAGRAAHQPISPSAPLKATPPPIGRGDGNP